MSQKRYLYTLAPTIKTYDGDNIFYDKRVVTNFAKKNIAENVLSLSVEEQEEYFRMCNEYRDLMNEVFDIHIKHVTDADWTLTEGVILNPIEKWEKHISQVKDEDFTEEEQELKTEITRLAKEWYEKQIS